MLSLASEIQTPFHRWPVGAKLAALALFCAGTFLIERPVVMVVPLGIVALAHLAAGWPFTRTALRALRPLAVFVAVLLVWHGALGELAVGLMLSARLLACVALANLVTMTSRLDDLLALFERLLAPLARLGLPTGAVGLAVAMVVRFLPVLSDRAETLSQAWRARSPRRARWRVVMPLTLSAIDDATHVAEAIAARGGVPRTAARGGAAHDATGGALSRSPTYPPERSSDGT